MERKVFQFLIGRLDTERKVRGINVILEAFQFLIGRLDTPVAPTRL